MLCRSQFSDEEMRRMDAPFEALDMFPDSMHRLLSYENMLTGALTSSEEGDATMLERNGVDTLDTCGFPLFSHDLQNESRNAEQRNPEMMLEEGKDGPSMAKRSRPIADTESTPGFEALVLEEHEDVVFQLTKRTRICYRDAFYRLAESSKANCSTANGNYSASRQSFQQPNGNASRFSTPGCPERETNPIDRTVMVLTMKPPPPPQLHANCCGDDSGPEAQSTTSWTTRARRPNPSSSAPPSRSTRARRLRSRFRDLGLTRKRRLIALLKRFPGVFEVVEEGVYSPLSSLPALLCRGRASPPQVHRPRSRSTPRPYLHFGPSVGDRHFSVTSLWLHGHPIGCLGLRFGSVALEIPPSNCCRPTAGPEAVPPSRPRSPSVIRSRRRPRLLVLRTHSLFFFAVL
ncbi:hypothetical protein GUJ93_ZPchr0009g651 [Zizania palustris]|uniref:PORR domain-containing protein n=1 Tax=Zizania palustris TaxID=103762 RepID=A0A8J5R226_ZIZPA|nr:hypothetical protein GUJ93_ZPchr0009g651 [Zizania palustris]